MNWFWNKKEKEEETVIPVEKETIASWENEPQKTAEELGKEQKEFQKYMELTKDLPKTVPMIGYKAVTADYEAFFGNQRYEVGKTYTESQPIVPCAHGFHFCRALKDAMKLFPPKKGIRYLKVEGEVPVTYYLDANDQVRMVYQNCANSLYTKKVFEYEKCGSWSSPGTPNNIHHFPPSLDQFDMFKTKYVTNKLTILEEVSFDIYADKALNELIETENEYYTTVEKEDFKLLAQIKWTHYVKDHFSMAFIEHVFKKYMSTIQNSQTMISQYVERYHNLIEAFDAIKDEDISQDMKILLLLTDLELM